MAEDVKVTNWPKDSSKERVAFDLATRIYELEHGYGEGKPDNPREHWLKLYSDCIRTVHSMVPPT